MISSLYALFLIFEVTGSINADLTNLRARDVNPKFQMQRASKRLRRSEPVTINDQDARQNAADASDTPYSNYTNINTSDKYPNGTEKSTAPNPNKKVDASGDYSSLYPPPPSVSLPPFSAIPYPLPLTGSGKKCPPRKHDDGLTVALPSDLNTGRFTKCGQQVVVVFDQLAGRPWQGSKNNLTLTVSDSFDSKGHSELDRTILLSEKAWKEATGNSIINKFESWPVRWFFLDAAMQQETADGQHENQNGEDDASAGNSTDATSGNQTVTDRGNKSPRTDEGSNSTTTSTKPPSNKRSLLSRRSSSNPSTHQHPLNVLKDKKLDDLSDDLDDAVSGLLGGGWATFFTQEGRPGACGQVHKDSDTIVALDFRRYGNLDEISQYCNRTVQITRISTGKTITATVADACPTCKNKNSLDLSEGAFQKLATKDEGMVSIKWKFA
ncbi:uncharacterized protein MELLADRAFT_79073 [Melampsora larici-populina 98AG31]|uniref:RlpA-like protein double-psi beta-barrel domain-containing protein n=1 Tax=Melampsora larici-populina (strain 98AG31 / pathotype 3-4-7) TaxID=747676 RepID=F4S2C4_MELLP|nr:uncharacterized protein MELLADRAFT_79073 [Melampsora larici-populina 98AG31]EGG01149.1 hypothetical protein MELLADRAFT_79073 [Melampsora larici-populina 98AG31]